MDDPITNVDIEFYKVSKLRGFIIYSIENTPWAMVRGVFRIPFNAKCMNSFLAGVHIDMSSLGKIPDEEIYRKIKEYNYEIMASNRK